MRPISILLFSCVLSFQLSAATRPAKARVLPPKDLLNKYLDSDFRGSRLAKDEQAPTTTLVTWNEEPQEDRLIVIQSFALGKIRSKRKVTRIRVAYSNLGELKGLVYFPGKTTEEATYDVVRKNGRWLIDRPILMPHVSVTVALEHLQKRLANVAADSNEATQIKASIASLEEQTGKAQKK